MTVPVYADSDEDISIPKSDDSEAKNNELFPDDRDGTIIKSAYETNTNKRNMLL